MTDNYGYKYPYNPNKELVEEAFTILQEYRRSMSAGIAANIDSKLAEAALMKRREDAKNRLHKFYEINISKVSRKK